MCRSRGYFISELILALRKLKIKRIYFVLILQSLQYVIANYGVDADKEIHFRFKEFRMNMYFGYQSYVRLYTHLSK